MLAIHKLIRQGRGLAPVLVRRAAKLELDWDQRQKSRLEAEDSTGRRLGVFLPRGSVMRGGDVLVAEDGSLIAVLAAIQPVLVVRHAEERGGTPFDLLRAAYHLGNRHVQIELQPTHLKIEPDPVLAEMLQRMGLMVVEAHFPFEPEAGAYAGDHAQHGHEHAHDHGHGHGQAQDHAHDHAHDHGHGHEHDHGHPHDH